MKRSINAAVYKDIGNHPLLPFIEKKFCYNELIFQHDLIPNQTAKSTKEWFKEKRIHVLDWPANSLNSNPIENILKILKRWFKKYYTSYLKELKRVIADVWVRVSLEFGLDLPERFKVGTAKVTTKYSVY